MNALTAPTVKIVSGEVIEPVRPEPCDICGTDTAQPGHEREGRGWYCGYVPPRRTVGLATEDVLVAPPSARRVR